MNDADRVIKTKELLDLLRELSELTTDYESNVCTYAERLCSIYGIGEIGAFRHHYSEISYFLYDHCSMKPEVCTTICDALEYIIGYIDDDNVSRAVEKLIDHVSLEALRIGQMQATFVKSGMVADIAQSAAETNEQMAVLRERQKQAEELQTAINKEIEDEKEEMQKLKADMDKQRIDHIGILSIFSGVVFAFTGGLTILGNVFANVKDITYEQSFFFLACIALVGIVMYNVICVLLGFVGKMVDREKAKPRCQYFVVNTILVLIMAAMLALYYKMPQCDGIMKFLKKIICH